MTAWLTARRVLALAYVTFLVYAFPGYTSMDSIMQFEQARSHAYSDWHPPAMAAVWTVVDSVVAGPAGMLLLQGGLLLAGTYRLLRRDLDDRRAALAAAAILLFPPVLAPMAVIWKDSLMAGLLVFAISRFDGKAAQRWLALAAATLAIAMRVNAPVALLPLVLVLLVWRAEQPRYKQLAIAFAFWLVATATATVTNRVLTRVPQHAWSCSLAPGDLGGIIRYTHGRYSDAELRQILAGTPLVVTEHIEARARRLYSPVTWWPMANGQERLFNWPVTEDERAAISRAWWTLVRDNPGPYLRHRWRVFKEVLGMTPNPVFDAVWQHHLPSQALHHDTSPGRVQAWLAAGVAWLPRATPLFRPYLYFALALVLLVIARRHRDIVAILASGVAYELTLVPFAPSPDYRYSHWMVTCTVLAGTMFAVRALRARSSRRRGRARIAG